MSKRTIRLAAAAAFSVLAALAAPPAAAQTFEDTAAAYERGDYAAAFAGFRILAGRGDAAAQNYLGVMYGAGKGVPQHYAEAVKWYRRAADQGYAAAQNNLGLMYEAGQGISRDYVRAHMWFNLAAARAPAGSPAAEEDALLYLLFLPEPVVGEEYLRKQATRSRDRVARRLSPEALASAQRLAQGWRPRVGVDRISPPPAADGGGADERREIAAIQRALVQLGYQPGPADGVLGQKTRAAIRAFQASAGLPVDGRPSDRLKRALALAEAKAAPASKPAPVRPTLARASTGSGFRVSADGRILTNAHVVRGCAEVRVPPAGPATVAARDEAADLALINGPPGAAAAFRQGRGVRPGAPVVVVGYPLRGVLAAGPNVSTGSVAALAGIRGDRREIQVTAPVQPGNSGGPVLDAAGNAVGVVVSRLDALRIARATGRVPQNVNFAVSAAAARAFLDSESVPYETASSNRARAPEDVAAAAKTFTVLIECWK